MKITLEYAGMLKVEAPPSGGSLELAEACTAGQLLTVLGIATRHHRITAVFVNNQRVPLTRSLADGDQVYLSVPMSGG